MTVDLTLTDVTRMHENRICIAGVDADGRCIRPVVDGGNLWEDYLTSIRGHTIHAFSVVRLKIGEARPDPPHTEDCVFNPFTIRYVASLRRSAARALLEGIADRDIASIFGAPITQDMGTFILRGEGTRSLGTVRVRQVALQAFQAADDGRARARLRVTDASGSEYALPVTDLAFMRGCDSLLARELSDAAIQAELSRRLDVPEVYLRIGLSRNWEKHPDRCYLQITGVYPFPETVPRG